jgi:flagellum-specific ATP synthase
VTPLSTPDLDPRIGSARWAARPERIGRVDRIVGMHAEVSGLRLATGDLVVIGDEPGIRAEVVAVAPGKLTALPLGSLHGIRAGEPVRSARATLLAPVGRSLVGRVLDGLGRPIDGAGPLADYRTVPLRNDPPPPLDRPLVAEPLQTGVRVIDGLLTVGRGQRVGIMAGSGVGKSSLLSMLLRGTDADVTVLALVGERGREVREFIEHDLGPEGLASCVVVVATSDQPALVRRNAAFLATRIAESFRDDGDDVLLLMDSLTRFAMAQREIGLAAGEVPTSKGYPPSVFALLPQLLERAGTASRGSITGFYTVLVEGDDLNDPIGDTSRAILDGHLSLSRKLANAGHYPSIDVLQSASRVAARVTTEDQQAAAAHFRHLLATYDEARDLLELGMYNAGSDAWIDEAVLRHTGMTDFAQQPMTQLEAHADTWAGLATALGIEGAPQAVPDQTVPDQTVPNQTVPDNGEGAMAT